ncbi:MAG: Amidohydrolase [Firmicutes bacterium ADurb.Bin300]|nr:MAG: Amidohydrolase [Firmicutes bacterium ADurb.Bin300]HOD02430.1 amidohydrolase family protein [Clostridiales bacterium]
MSDYRIFANHAHVFPEGSKSGATVEDLKKLMEQCEIEKAVCFATFTEQNTRVGADANTNRWLASEIKSEPNLVGFGTLDFDKGNLTKQVEEIADLGLKGIKVHPAYQEVRVDGEELFEVYGAASERNLFISFHTGLHWHRLSDYHMLLWDEVAYNFPLLRFSMEHMGGYSFFKEALAVMNNNKRGEFDRVFAGWTSIDMSEDEFGNIRAGAWSLTDEQLCDIIFQTGENRSIFGLDFPYNNAEKTKKSIERIKNLPISETAKRGILGDNLRRILGEG